MWNDMLLDKLGKYEGQKIRSDITRNGITFPKRYKGYLNDYWLEDGTGSIDVCVISKRYGNYGEERNWTATHNIRIDLENYMITGFDVEDRVFGDEGLGDYDPSDVFSRAAYFDQSECFVRKLLSKGE